MVLARRATASPERLPQPPRSKFAFRWTFPQAFPQLTRSAVLELAVPLKHPLTWGLLQFINRDLTPVPTNILFYVPPTLLKGPAQFDEAEMVMILLPFLSNFLLLASVPRVLVIVSPELVTVTWIVRCRWREPVNCTYLSNACPFRGTRTLNPVKSLTLGPVPRHLCTPVTFALRLPKKVPHVLRRALGAEFAPDLNRAQMTGLHRLDKWRTNLIPSTPATLQNFTPLPLPTALDPRILGTTHLQAPLYAELP